jgi:hypothetical protein
MTTSVYQYSSYNPTKDSWFSVRDEHYDSSLFESLQKDIFANAEFQQFYHQAKEEEPSLAFSLDITYQFAKRALGSYELRIHAKGSSNVHSYLITDRDLIQYTALLFGDDVDALIFTPSRSGPLQGDAARIGPLQRDEK